MMTNLLKLAAAAAACLAMAACNGGESGGGGEPDGSGGAEAGGGDAGGSNRDAGAAAASQDSPDGAVTLFVQEMQKPDFLAAQAYVDPSCELYSELSGLADSIVNAANAGEQAQNMIKNMFRLTYVGATHTVRAPSDGRAEAVMHFANKHGDQSFQLNELDGNWYIVAGKNLAQTTQPGG